MRIQFLATDAGFEADEYALVAGTGGVDSNGEEHYITLQRDSEDNVEDWGVYFEFDGQGYGDYGCVARCRLSMTALQIDLSRQLGDLVGVTGFDVELQVDRSSIDELRRGLLRIFRDIPEVLSVQ